jgi:hypothetical protein
MSQQLHQEFSHESDTQRETTEELPDGELTTITGGSTAQDAQKGAIGGSILGGGMGVMSGAYAAGKYRAPELVGGVLGAVLGGGVGAADGAAASALGGAILKDKHRN